MKKFCLPALGLIIISVVVYLGREPDPEPGGAGEEPVKRGVGPIEVVQEEWTRREVSRDEIANLSNSDEVVEVRHQLLLGVMDDLESLRTVTDRARIKVVISARAQQLYLLKRAMEVKGISASVEKTFPSELGGQVESLVALWTENQVLANEADRIFSQMNVLDCEHIPYLLRQNVAIE